MSGKKKGWIIFALLLLVVIGGAVYFILKKKYYPKVEGLEYLKLELAKDTAQVKAGVQVQNRIPLSISLDSINYAITDEGDTLGWGQMTTDHTLPPLGDKVVDFSMELDFEKYRKHLQEQQGKDSLRLDVAMDVYFDLPIISQKSITVNRQLTVPVAKAPKMEVQDLIVRSFSPDSGYSFLLKIDATNKNLPGLIIDNFRYDIQIDSLQFTGGVDTTFHLQKGSKLLEVPLQLKTSDAIALIEKKLSGDDLWKYDAKIQAQISSDHPIFDSFRLTVAKSGELDISKMGTGENYLPTVKQIKRLEIDSNEEQTRLNANIVVHNPAPIPFYIDSASYYIRHKGQVIASGKKDFEKILPKSGDQSLNLQLLVDESAYQQFMKKVQDQKKVNLEVELNLVYNLPEAKRQKISLRRQVQVPVPGQAGIQVAGLEVKELDPKKGAQLNLKLKVESSNLPNLRIKNLDYRLQLSDDILLTGQTKEPIRVSEENAIVEVPIHLSADDVNQLIRKALKGNTNWAYELQATAKILSDNDILGPTKINLEFTGDLELAKGTGGQKLLPQITSIDTLEVTIAYDTAWVRLNIKVRNPLPVPFYVDSLALKLTHEQDTIAFARENVNKILPAEGTQTAWITLAVNYETWRNHLVHHQEQDSMLLKEFVTLVFHIDDLESQQVSFVNEFQVPTPKVPVTKLKKVKLRGFSFTKGILVTGLVQVNNANTKGLEISDITYNVCVEKLLDVCGTINRTYDIPLGTSIVKVPLNLGIGEAFRAFFARLMGKSKTRNLYINSSATIDTANPKIKNTYVRFEKWEKSILFNKNKKSGTRNETSE
ncbi:LEA type 2 family protein [Pontibacter locisalis]|uniref:LEA type 2 family protein n=1 Tax=Pontibacter locisalis TaxID=1719035 RepID=A0ABW5IG77_9BACT